MDVISRSDEGPTYSAEWVEPWTAIRDGVHEIKYSVGNKLIKGFDTLWSSFKLGVHPEVGIRWARRAYELALKLCRERLYSAWQNGTLSTAYPTSNIYDQFKAERVVDIYHKLITKKKFLL